ncbi:MAG: DNA-directed RNA polymerase subunit alpha [Chloroflexota bacterium]
MFEIVVPKVEVLEQTENHGTVQLEPLEPGFGTTLGNALRRVLLSSLPGAAVNSLRIDGVYHEFADIPGVKEDVTELVLNVKQLRLRYDGDEPKSIHLEIKGVGRVTAADLQAPPEIEIVNPELYLMSIDLPEGGVTLEMTVQKGKGYSPADHHEDLPIGVIPVDAIFTPIRKVNFAVEETRIGVTTYERLLLDVWTDGTIKPDEAVAESANILTRQFGILSGLVAKPELPGEKQAVAAAAIPPRLYDVPIEDLDLTVRAYNCLKRAGIVKVGQVLEMSEDDLLSVRNFGRKSLDELRERLAARGYLENSRLAETAVEEGEAAIAEDEEALVEGEAEGEEEEEEEELILPARGEEEEVEIPTYTFTPEVEEEAEAEEEGRPAKEPEFEGVWDPNRDWDEDEDEQGFKKKAGRRRRPIR